MSNWPQWTYLALLMIGLGVSLARFGEPKRDRYDFVDLLAPALALWLLWMGNFFAPITG
jgi:hypothetical protein